ncbi:MAG TPA: PAS domain-containing protein, partial [Bacteroidia bacterium]|nr:PAS domain-containing protein [Bacteroidia bacterium]
RSLVQNSTDITTILDERGHTVYESPSFYRTFGYKEEEVLGKNIFNFIHPEDIEKAAYELTKGVERGGISDPIEFRIRHRNGSWLYVESVGNNLLSVPGIEGIVINSRDITDRKDAEAKSEKLKEFYEEILNKIPTDIVVFDNRHRYVFINENAIRDPEKRAFLIGKDDYDYCETYGKDIAIAHERRAVFNKVAYTKQQIEFEEFFENGGRKVWMLRRMYPLLDAKDELKNMIGFGFDISIRKQALQKLEESEQRLSLAVEAAKLGIWDWDLQTGKLLWDRGMYRIFGIDPGDFNEDYEAFEKTLHPDDKKRVFDSVQETISGVKGDFSETFRIHSKSGEVKYVAAYSKLIKNEIGQPVRMIGINFNITDNKLAEQKILRSQSELEEAQRIARIGSWEVDMGLQKVTWSKEMYEIYEVEVTFEPTFDNSLSFFTDDTREAVVTAFEQAGTSMNPFDIEAMAQTGKGKLIDVRTKGVPTVDANGALRVSGILQDISKEKTAERQLKEYTQDLERINKELDQFAYIVSHDLKAPLRAINNLSTWIEEDLEGKLEGETQYQFKLLRGRVSRMEDLINGILNYSRAGRVKVNPGNVDVLNLVNSLIEFLSPPSNFKVTVTGDFPVLHTEKILLEQVFSNLISNAIKYNKNPEPEISITCEPDGAFYRFGVADNGDGIEPEYHEKIFVIFQTLEARDKVESTGVGLAIVKKIIEEKGGQVWVESAKGLGAKFYFTWPR